MIEITPVMIAQERFLGIRIYLPKCTLRLLMNMKLICVDEYFDLEKLQRKCSVPLIQCQSAEFEQMSEHRCLCCSKSAEMMGIDKSMSVKEAVQCVFSNGEPFAKD